MIKLVPDKISQRYNYCNFIKTILLEKVLNKIVLQLHYFAFIVYMALETGPMSELLKQKFVLYF
jgi:hypothetical protein